jgi:hypothetical protein
MVALASLSEKEAHYLPGCLAHGTGDQSLLWFRSRSFNRKEVIEDSKQRDKGCVQAFTPDLAQAEGRPVHKTCAEQDPTQGTSLPGHSHKVKKHGKGEKR